MLEPLLQGFNEPGLRGDYSTAPIDDASANGIDEETPSVAASDDTSSSFQDAEEEKEAAFDSGSIGDDIAALEAELQEEEGLALDKADGEGGTLSVQPLGGKEDAVRKAAWCLFEVLLPRCVGLEGQALERKLEEPTSFSHRYIVDHRSGRFCIFNFLVAAVSRLGR